MRIRTVLAAGLAGGVGYVLGARAGQGRYDELKARADRLAHSPQVQETVTNLAEGVKKNAAKLPDPVADAVTKVADTVKGATDAEPGKGAGAGLADADLGGSGSSTSSASSTNLGTSTVSSSAAVGAADLGAAEFGTSDLGTSDL